MRYASILATLFCALVYGSPASFAQQPTQPSTASSPFDVICGVGQTKPARILFLGDSITHAGKYVAYVETLARLEFRDAVRGIEFINCGLSSETVSGLSEEGHAGGKFPRPTVHERLDRVLAEVKPEVVVACYGMNCGIYKPLAEERFAKYREGIESLRKKCFAAGAKQVVHLTPPVFDALPIKDRVASAGSNDYSKPYAGYDEVLEAYGNWLLSKRADGWEVVDVHGPMKALIRERRQTEPEFTVAKDGVHPNNLGHWLIAKAIMNEGKKVDDFAKYADGEAAVAAFPHGAEVLKLVEQRLALMHDAYLTATKHKRPGVKEGLPLPEAKQKSMEIEAKIVELLKTPGKS
ncbi:MAG: SGNH/GDSL hydrolase family protein [Planctomycetales bacterium]|nr:SGNH/GDSL hydrolase family protein [Planctomycetales bacterium]MBN8623926.1 SGNH/GDSL hydrolase family protein [Planctomycetota bacterium]